MKNARRAPAEEHVHLPSVHVRRDRAGYDYEEDVYIRGRRADHLVRLVVIENGEAVLVRETVDQLCAEDLADLREDLPGLMDEKDTATRAFMEERARAEFGRQRRIAAGQERACLSCGCSETRACSGGCVWASETLCSRCA